MDITNYHAKYFAYELTKRYPSDSAEKLAGALVDAQVDLNPRQRQGGPLPQLNGEEDPESCARPLRMGP